MINNKVQKKISIRYNSMTELLNREEHMKQTLTNTLARLNEYTIIDTYLSTNDNEFKLNFIIESI